MALFYPHYRSWKNQLVELLFCPKQSSPRVVTHSGRCRRVGRRRWATGMGRRFRYFQTSFQRAHVFLQTSADSAFHAPNLKLSLTGGATNLQSTRSQDRPGQWFSGLKALELLSEGDIEDSDAPIFAGRTDALVALCEANGPNEIRMFEAGHVIEDPRVEDPGLPIQACTAHVSIVG